jgi:SAM-dependent methyltransferase
MLWVLKRLLRKLSQFGQAPHPGANHPPHSLAGADPTFSRRKADKLSRIRPLLRSDLPHRDLPLFFDFLTDDLRREFNIVDTTNVSAHAYDQRMVQIIEEAKGGLILDCGAGFRPVYYDNVVNFEICPYDSTDVRGVGEQLPFRDEVFDAVFSIAMLEHVKDPFACAREITRVLKPGGRLYCMVPFLQPYHGYPHHYYNMSHQGVRNLFDRELLIEKQEVPAHGLPIWTLSWFLSAWANGLPFWTKVRFLNMRVADLTGVPGSYLNRPFVNHLSAKTNFELASATVLTARKPLK